MGKKGAAMRAEKAKSAMIYVSQEWLAEHDKQVIKEYEKKKRDVISEATLDAITFVLPVSMLVLVRDFGWGRLRKSGDEKNSKIVKFMLAVEQEADRIFCQKEMSLAEYRDLVFDFIGIGAEVDEVITKAKDTDK